VKKPSVKFWLPTDSEPGSEASDFEDYFEEEKGGGASAEVET